MKFIVLLVVACLFRLESMSAQQINPGYDSTLAGQLHADDYGMKYYVLVILKTGTNDVQDKALRDSLFAGHFANMATMAEAGKLIVAGPIAKNDRTYRGIFILDVPTFEDALILLQNDPTIREKILEPELYSWYGSAALPVYLDTHDKIQKYSME
jgi:uncharacterized protein YciI